LLSCDALSSKDNIGAFMWPYKLEQTAIFAYNQLKHIFIKKSPITKF